MIDFTKAKRGKSKESGIKVKLAYTLQGWYANVGNTKYRIADKCLLLNGATTLYSLPFNDQQEYWTKKVLDAPIIIQERIDVIKVFWSRYYDKQIVRGKVINNEFYIK